MENLSVIDELIKKARAAQEKVADYTQEQIDEVCRAVAWQVYKDENIQQLAKLAVEETGMGKVKTKSPNIKTRFWE